jgi:transaldolase
LNASVIPATEAGLPAIAPVIGEGISVNVTLIFSVERHRAVMDAYQAGLEAAREAGHDLSKIHSIASLFVSRVDHRDRRQAGDDRHERSARAARSGRHRQRPPGRMPAMRKSSSAGSGTRRSRSTARVQRPLWASTRVKNSDYSDTMYVTELVAPTP